MMNNERNEFLFEHMMHIAKSIAEKIDKFMNCIFQHLQTHAEWDKAKELNNHTLVERQDDDKVDKVGLLKETGIRNVADINAQDEDDHTKIKSSM